MVLEAKPPKINRRVNHVRLMADDVANLVELMRFEDDDEKALTIEADGFVADSFADLAGLPAVTGKGSITELIIRSALNRLTLHVGVKSAFILDGFRAPDSATFEAEKRVHAYLRNRRDRLAFLRFAGTMFAMQWTFLLIAQAILLLPDPHPSGPVIVVVLVAIVVVNVGGWVWVLRRDLPDVVWLKEPPRFTDRHINIAGLVVAILGVIATVAVAVVAN